MDEAIRHALISEIIEAAIEVAPSQRDKTIRSLCHGDNLLENEVFSLISNIQGANELLEEPLFYAEKILESKPDIEGFGTLVIPGFDLIKILGQGSSSIVYLAKQLNPQREVAIKILRPTSCSDHAIKRMNAEAHLLARLEHPDIARIYQVGLIQSSLYSQPFLVMEKAHGLPLHEFLIKNEIEFDQRLELIIHICETLHFAHQRGVIHRDLKPSNILVDFDDANDQFKIKIIDFGIAKLIHGEAIPIDVQTLSPSLLGTLRYMSPERMSEKSSGDTVASDMYSIGVLASECLLGGDCRDDILSTLALPVSKTDNESYLVNLQHLLQRMTAADIKMRFESLNDVVNSFRLLSDSEVPPQRSGGHRLQLLTLLSIVSGAFLIGGVVYKNRSTPTLNIKQSTLLPKQPLDLMLSALRFSELETNQNQDTKLDIFKTRIRLIAENARDGHQQESLRVIEIVENDSMPIEQYPAKSQRAYYSSKGFALGKSGFTEKAKEAYLTARSMISLDTKPLLSVAIPWRHIAHGLGENNAMLVARQMYMELIEHPDFHTLPWIIRSNALGNMAGSHWANGDFIKAEQMFREIVESAPENLNEEQERRLAEKLSSLGVVLTSLSKLDEAEMYLKRAIDIAVKYFEPSHRVMCRYHRNLGTTYLLQGRYEDSVSVMLYVRGIWGAMPNGWIRELASADFVLGSAFLEMGMYDQAFHYLQLAQTSTSQGRDSWAKLLSHRVDNAMGAYLCETGNAVEGNSLLRSSERSILEAYGTGSLWGAIVQQRAIRYKSVE